MRTLTKPTFLPGGKPIADSPNLSRSGHRGERSCQRCVYWLQQIELRRSGFEVRSLHPNKRTARALLPVIKNKWRTCSKI